MVLVTGFEPFTGMGHTPSAALLGLLPDTARGEPILKAVLPVDALALPQALENLHARGPRAVLHLGLAENRSSFTLERLALNLLDFERPDNQGRVLADAPVVPGGPLALEARFPLTQNLHLSTPRIPMRQGTT